MTEKGFMTVGLIIYLPLLFALMFSFYWIVWFLNQKHQLENICFRYILAAQDDLINGNNRLIQLNPQAQRLIIEKKFLNTVIKTAPPKVRAVAYLRKKQIIAQQALLKSTQESLLLSSEYRSRQQMRKLHNEIQKHFRQMQDFWQTQPAQAPHLRPQWRKSQVQIDQKDIAPTYKRSQSHSQQQTLKMHWSLPLNQVAPQWLVRLASIQPKWLGFCESHPYHQGGKWHSSIGAGKASWKQLF